MIDTSEIVARLVAERHASMTAEERMRIAAALFETARAIVESSLPKGLTREQRRYAVAKRLYGDELPEAALVAHAKYTDGQSGGSSDRRPLARRVGVRL